MRSIWAGAISFGLVVIPVKLYAATEQRDIAFRQVHRKDGARIQFRRFCTLDGEEVPYSDVAKGYELPTGDMVVLTDEDLADLPLVTAHRIEVLHFAPAAQVEPIYAAKSYYTEPDPAGARAYVLFRDALENSGKVAVAKVALRQREALAALRVRDGVITLETLLWPDEVRKPDFAFLDEDIEVRSQELKMAASLIDTMTEDFDPDQYHDDYREALEAVVRAKIEGNDLVRPAGLDAPEPKGQPADLTEILRASVAAVKSERAKATANAKAKDEEPSPPSRAPAAKPPHERAGPDPALARRDRSPWATTRSTCAASPTAPVSPGGQGVEPALCVHGLAGSSRNWTDLMDLLRPALAADALDLPGFGDSPPRPDGRYGIAAYAQTVAALIERRRPGPGSPDRQLPGRRGRGQSRRHPPGPGQNPDPDLPGPARLAAPAGPGPVPADEPALRRRPAAAQVRAPAAGSPRGRRHRHLLQRPGPVPRRPGSPPRSPNSPGATPWTTPTPPWWARSGPSPPRPSAPEGEEPGATRPASPPRPWSSTAAMTAWSTRGWRAARRARSAGPGSWCCPAPATWRTWNIPPRWPPRSARSWREFPPAPAG